MEGGQPEAPIGGVPARAINRKVPWDLFARSAGVLYIYPLCTPRNTTGFNLPTAAIPNRFQP
jgi:hypothetical protein